MCEVHLIEESRDACFFTGTCCSPTCGDRIDGEAVRVVGHLDDGTPGRLTFHYHVDCADDLQWESGDDGCFSYGTPTSEECVDGERTSSSES